MLESVVSWLTPTALFLLLNLVIATIAFISSRSSSSAASAGGGGPHRTPSMLSRSSSIVLDRLKSFNLYSSSHRPSDPATETIQTVQFPKIEQPEPDAPQPEHERHIARSQSDTQPAAGEMPKKLAKKMKKSATLESAFNRFDFHEPEQESPPPPKRPETAREREKEKDEDAADAEVDARADDFINRFRQQLKLQRLDSIIRYKEMLKRGI